MSDECDLCGLPLGDEAVSSEGNDFCCPGCREVHRTLAENPDVDASPTENQTNTLDEDLERLYLRVPEMRCTSCEAFLTLKANQLEGVKDARANYASEMVMVDYDPDRTREHDITDGLSTGGYRPHRPDDSGDQRSRQVGRLIVGGFFGMMAMLWYVLFIYPMYLGVPVENLLLDLTGDAGQYLYFNLFVMSGVVVFYTGWPILRGAWVGLRSGYPNMDVLIALAVLNAFVFSAFVLYRGGLEVYFDISVVVVLVVTLGRYFEIRLKQNALRKVRSLSTESIGTVRVKRNNTWTELERESVQPGDVVLANAGDEIPVDGTVHRGNGHVDESLVTGESQPIRKEEGDAVLSGSLLREGSIEVEVTREANGTFVDLLRDRMWEIQSAQFSYQKLADKLSALFVPVVLFLAGATFVGAVLMGAAYDTALLRAMTLLVVSCPCALGLATPMATMTALEALLGRGVAPRTATSLENDTEPRQLVLDKTGTITTDDLTVRDNGSSRESKRLAAAVESRSNHPLANTLEQMTDKSPEVSDFSEYTGEGVTGRVEGREVLVGNTDLINRHDLSIPEELKAKYRSAYESGARPVYVGWDGTVRDVIVLEEQVRDELDDVLDAVADRDLDVVVLTGDDRPGIESLIDHPALSTVHRQVKPEAKVKLVESLQQEGPIVMVGDGKNDAPALARADLGIAVGNRTALASNAADLVFVRDSLEPLPDTLEILQQTGRRVRQNLGWAFLYNAIAIPAALLGYLNPLVAALAMSASSLIVVLNSRRGFT